jgi:hypothetical protein
MAVNRRSAGHICVGRPCGFMTVPGCRPAGRLRRRLRQSPRLGVDLEIGGQVNKQHAGRSPDRPGTVAAAAGVVGEEHLAAAPALFPAVAGLDLDRASQHGDQLPPRRRVPVLVEPLPQSRSTSCFVRAAPRSDWIKCPKPSVDALFTGYPPRRIVTRHPALERNALSSHVPSPHGCAIIGHGCREQRISYGTRDADAGRVPRHSARFGRHLCIPLPSLCPVRAGQTAWYLEGEEQTHSFTSGCGWRRVRASKRRAVRYQRTRFDLTP